MKTLIKPVLLFLLCLTILSSCGGGENKPDEQDYVVICKQMGASPKYVDKYMKDNIKNLKTDSEDVVIESNECAGYMKNCFYYPDESYEGFERDWSYIFTEKGLVASVVYIENAMQFDPAKFKDFSELNLKISRQVDDVLVEAYCNDEETLQLVYMREEFEGEAVVMLMYYDLEFVNCMTGGGTLFPFEMVNVMRRK